MARRGICGLSAPFWPCFCPCGVQRLRRSTGVDPPVRRCLQPHYLDDFLLLGAPGSLECLQDLHSTLTTCQELGIPLALHKVEGPTTRLVFLGIGLDSSQMALSLPDDKLLRLRGLMQQWSHSKCIRDPQQFQSLLGHLVHTTQVVPLGKAYLNHLFSLAQDLRPGQFRCLNCAARANIAWWANLCDLWPGISVHQFLLLQEPSHHLYSDASGSCGCGAWSLPWQGIPHLNSIALKELVPNVLACALWGASWRDTYVICHSDNTAAVAQVNKLRARDPIAAHLLRCFAFFQTSFDFRIWAVHISRQFNTGDDLSRDRAGHFLAAYPSASPTQLRYHLRCWTCSSRTRQTGHRPRGGSFAAISGGRISPLHAKGVHSGLEPLPQICTHLQSRLSSCDQ